MAHDDEHVPDRIQITVPTPTHRGAAGDEDGSGGRHTDEHQGAWLFSPPSLAAMRSPRGGAVKSTSGSRRSSFFFVASTPPHARGKDTNPPARLQRLQHIPEDKTPGRRRRITTPYILLGSILVFGAIAVALLTTKHGTSGGDSSSLGNNNAADKGFTTTTTTMSPPIAAAPVTTSIPPTTTTAIVESKTMPLSEDTNSSGIGDGATVAWQKYKFYFVNECSIALNIYQKYTASSAADFCPLPMQSYGCAGNRSGTYFHTPSASIDQATLFEVTLNTPTGTHYDISIIPPGCHEEKSLAACKAVTGKVGFNLPMRVTVLHTACRTRDCPADGCTDAYNFPKDDVKTTGCQDPDAIYQVTFCPRLPLSS
ncbi:Aste57867_20745 [Aphanomyces stellatus]|uniref:Aste57867_20745 protein n=1 Tax=Aphanomyces stellatus TaxID=120398 RepID=A0A485LFP9_9STRA|nr:hypothetical protein As57867_020677 [Aphanomyces stellatus]VFT97424.1 Aste57867_20745 [Aphanomyces stellatus]